MEGKRTPLANQFYHLIRIKKIDRPALAKALEVSDETISGWFDGSLAMTEEQEEKGWKYLGSLFKLSPDFQELFNKTVDDYIKEKTAERRKAQKEKSQ
jgi:hypothetical protein